MPDFAIVPRFAMASSRDIPMPLSEIVIVPASASTDTRMRRSGSVSSNAAFSSASKRSLSTASDEFEMSSRRKISLFEYKEWIINCRSCRASA